MAIRIPSPAIGGYAADPQVVSAVRTASVATGTGFDTLMASAEMESGLNPGAKARTSSASGLFQFTEQTWLATVKQFGAAQGLQAAAAAIVPHDGQLTVADPTERQRILNMRFDPAISSMMAGDHLKDLAGNLAIRLGRPPDAAETYLAHFLGASGAAQMLKAAQATPDVPAARILPAAAKANPAAFTMADGTPRSAVQFVQRIRDRVNQAFQSIGSVPPEGALPFGQSTGTSVAAVSAGPMSSRWYALAVSSRTTSERAMAASLLDVFTRLDQSKESSQGPREKKDHGLPFGLVSTLAAVSGT
ncbi:lytic transglycosylase domain-containing protein [Rhodopila globiformis]|uniref:Transglycosylase SLT domain-containing protein n=1 Tax=Rhodopila globiformis TaxID=1071 RepID=A0A2S6MZ48_RHOGL|nr:lytic transglycosylase domain-containing protein [Rhodopila globiformis]PPQ27620.1 hypothetical protein CCS01_26770 [Rhodopila globiformis]